MKAARFFFLLLKEVLLERKTKKKMKKKEEKKKKEKRVSVIVLKRGEGGESGEGKHLEEKNKEGGGNACLLRMMACRGRLVHRRGGLFIAFSEEEYAILLLS